MNTKLFILISCLLLIATSSFAKSRTVKGNGNLVNKEISIKDYDAIEALGGVTIEYEQSSASPYLQLTIDENILPYLDIRVKGKTLSIGFKDESDDYYDDDDDESIQINNGEVKYRSGLSISATKYIITTNSETLKDINLVGGCHMNINSKFKAERFNANIAGSGSINFSKPTDIHKGDFSIAGSGEINLRTFRMTNLNCSIAGGGEINLNGKADKADYSVAGGGNIYGYNCNVKKAECSVAGGGSIQVYATEQLDASTAGGGKIRYKGNPTISEDVVAGGSIKRYEE
ncbi:head GIN domain-containing protein [Parabacteroides sp. AM08-6]|uniref:head GIN domain-containing protein n=1 Tax=Parabacteroides sp. AM08-6 TaxID=2292053 RepID=UPI000F000535|nr:head GIN domain-containing protein [Parabacteroides sp. AM08-6]RHJ82706.1 DUF2807 domain-containing protein [Parabacteroides sp. AM08-6]